MRRPFVPKGLLSQVEAARTAGASARAAMSKKT
jgi:hypothetical protein